MSENYVSAIKLMRKTTQFNFFKNGSIMIFFLILLQADT